MKGLFWIFFVLCVVGAINWGLIGLFEFNLVTALFGDMTTGSRIAYFVIGLSGLLLAIMTPGLVTHENFQQMSTTSPKRKKVHSS